MPFGVHTQVIYAKAICSEKVQDVPYKMTLIFLKSNLEKKIYERIIHQQ